MIVWTDEFSVRHAEVDTQHKELLDIINQLDSIAGVATVDAHDKFHLQLHRLTQYANKHFAFEEQVMQEKGCPNLEAHANEHMKYCEHMCNVLYEACMGVSDRRQLCDWLNLWWSNHILVDDRECLLA